MSTNANVKAKRQQLVILIASILGVGALCGGIYYFGEVSDAMGGGSGEANIPVDPQPNMTGVMTNSFTDQVSEQALAQQQAKTASLEQKMAELQAGQSQQKDLQNQLQQQLSQTTATNLQLQEQLKTMEKQQTGKPLLPQTDINGNPIPGQLSTTPAPPTSFYKINEAGSPQPGQGSNFYPGIGKGSIGSGGLKPTSFNYNKKKKNELPYIPSGSFSEALMIEGADANASVTGQQNTVSVQFRLRGKVQLPNDQEYDLSGCFMTGEIWGDISSERGEVRTRKLSCKLKQGTVDMTIPGHAAYQGKQGIRGKPVMRNGKMIAYSGASGFLSGIGGGVSQAATPAVGLGATASVGMGDVLKQGFGSGAEKAANNVSDYYIKVAEQYHPVIDIGAGNVVTIVFQDGFQLETIENALAKKAQEEVATQADQAGDKIADGASQASTSIGNINPDEILKKASQLRLGQTVE
ncbi:protein TraB (plasmid) [Serratia plymuthica 4Rx13]|uniref:Conjugal transfer protein TraB n=1 Tax=Serratia plymuthica TaxID=82996 RepID=A0A318NWB5_SERPL|nr:F-type conjugal transfer pilus assembly protein TraB [Serratia plymuthica]AGO57697.1 protein TraB [Serratia plymuthica 4Rx13]PYD36585.1 conjugal transfer protein TraB [Serratia plymuthica]